MIREGVVDRKRIAIIGSRGFPSRYGGFETFVRHLAPFLRDVGFDVSVYCRGPGFRPRAEFVEGVRCVWTGGVNRKTVSTLSYGFTASLHCAAQRPDAALVLNVANGFYLPILRRAGVPTAVNVDGMEWKRAKWNAVGQRVFRWGAGLTARYADAIVVDSEAIGAVWNSMFRVKTHFIPYGAEIVQDPGNERLHNMGLKPGSYVLAVARLVPENNVELLLRAMKLLDPAAPTVIVGSAPTPTALEAELRRLALSSPNFHWLGHVDDDDLLAELWSNCGVYFHGHSVGGTNPALLQALGCGSPTVALDTPFNREVIDHPEHICAADARLIADRIAVMLDDSRLRARMAARGRAIVGTRYRWDEICNDYAKLLLKLAVEGVDDGRNSVDEGLAIGPSDQICSRSVGGGNIPRGRR